MRSDEHPPAEEDDDDNNEEEVDALGNTKTKTRRVDRLGNTVESSSDEEGPPGSEPDPLPEAGSHSESGPKDPAKEEEHDEEDKDEPPYPNTHFADAGADRIVQGIADRIAQGIADKIADKMAQEMAHNMAQGVAQDIAGEIADQMANALADGGAAAEDARGAGHLAAANERARAAGRPGVHGVIADEQLQTRPVRLKQKKRR